MGVRVLSRLTFDIYRGEFTVLFTERIQDRMMNTIEDLLTGKNLKGWRIDRHEFRNSLLISS